MTTRQIILFILMGIEFFIPIIVIFELHKPFIQYFKNKKNIKKMEKLKKHLKNEYPSLCLFFENLDNVALKINKHYNVKGQVTNFESYNHFVNNLKECCYKHESSIAQSILNAFIDDFAKIINKYYQKNKIENNFVNALCIVHNIGYQKDMTLKEAYNILKRKTKFRFRILYDFSYYLMDRYNFSYYLMDRYDVTIGLFLRINIDSYINDVIETIFMLYYPKAKINIKNINFNVYVY